MGYAETYANYMPSKCKYTWDVLFLYRRWAGKTSYVHLAPEHEYRTKHLMKAYKN